MTISYQKKIRMFWRISLVESVKILIISLVGLAVINFLTRIVGNNNLDGLLPILKLLYLLLVMIILPVMVLQPIIKTFFKAGYRRMGLMIIFLIINISVISLVILLLSLIVVDINNINQFLRGPYSVTIFI